MPASPAGRSSSTRTAAWPATAAGRSRARIRRRWTARRPMRHAGSRRTWWLPASPIASRSSWPTGSGSPTRSRSRSRRSEPGRSTTTSSVPPSTGTSTCVRPRSSRRSTSGGRSIGRRPRTATSGGPTWTSRGSARTRRRSSPRTAAARRRWASGPGPPDRRPSMYAVILAGGGGTRLWPLSRPDRPKPFLPLLGERTLLRATFDRLVPELLPAADVAVVTDRRYAALVLEELPELDRGQVLGEPTGRNTAAAIAYAAAAIERQPDDVMLVLPADHLVRDEAAFRALLRDAAALAAGAAPGTGDPGLVTLGIAPSGPETGYGYIVAGRPRAGASRGRAAVPGAFDVARFVEKPSAEAAAALLAGPAAVAWNAGIFAWRRDSIRAALATHAPDILAAVEAGLRATAGDPAALDAAYATVRATSIDYAVMEPASHVGNVAMLGADVGWSDLGSWAALRDALVAEAIAAGEPAGVVGFGARRDRGSESTLVMSGGRLVVTMGLRDTIVVDTPDALLVCAADRSQEVRAIAEELARAREEDT